MRRMKRSIAIGLVVLAALGAGACGGPEERKAKYRVRAQEYFEQGNYPKARVALRNVLQIDPKDVEAYFLYAQVEEKERNWRNAFAGYQQVVELSPDHDRALIKLAKYYLEARALEQVTQITGRILERQPDHVPAQAVRIAMTAVSGHLDEAIEQAARLVGAAPTETDAVLLVASLYAANHRAADAVPLVRRALEAHPGHLELLDALATTLVKAGRVEDAEVTLKQIMTLEPTVLGHRLRFVAFLDQQQRYDQAEALLQEAVRQEPDSDQRRLALVEYLAKRRGLAQAEAALQQAIHELPLSGTLRLALAGVYEATQRPELASETYHLMQKEFAGKPESAQAQVKLAALDWTAGRMEEAEQRIQAVLKENPQSSEALLLRGKIALQRGHGKDAVLDFRSVLKDQPDLAEGHVLLARAHLAAGESMLARESLDRATAIKPGLIEAHLMLAGLDAAAGQFTEAKRRIEPLLARDPGNTGLLGALFQLQLQEKDWGRSRDTLAQLRQAGADAVGADLAEGHIALAQQEWDKAEAAFGRAAERRPAAPEPLLALVQLDLRRGQLAHAQQRLEAIMATVPDHPYAAGFLGEVLLTKGAPQEAATQFEHATRINPTWITPWIHLARVHYAQQRTAEGDAALLKGVQARPENEEARLLLAVSLGSQRRFDDAMGHYEAVLRRNPASVLAANNLAVLLIDYKGDPKSLDRALTLSHSFETQPPNPYLLDTLGWAHHKLGHGTDAVRVLRQATALAPDHPVLNYHLGAALAKSGERAEAAVYLKKALAVGAPFEGLGEAKTLLGEVVG